MNNTSHAAPWRRRLAAALALAGLVAAVSSTAATAQASQPAHQGEFSFTFPSPGVLDMTLTLLP